MKYFSYIVTLIVAFSNFPLGKGRIGVSATNVIPNRALDTGSCYTGDAASVRKECYDIDTGKYLCCGGPNGEEDETACSGWAGDSTICEGACMGEGSCKNLPLGSTIKQDACTGVDACGYLGESAEPKSSVFVDKSSCDGERSCFKMGEDNADNIHVGMNSCIGARSCFALGFKRATEIQIGEGSCLNANSCRNLGQYHVRNIKVGNSTCTATGSCDSMVKFAIIRNLEVNDNACENTDECKRCEMDLEAENFLVASSNSCTSTDSPSLSPEPKTSPAPTPGPSSFLKTAQS